MPKSHVKLSALWGLASAALLTGFTMTPSVMAASIPTLYVATSGNNTTGTGTATSPYQTISYALTKAPTGAAIVVEPGTYNESISITKTVTLEAASAITKGAGSTIISGAGLTALNPIVISGSGANGSVINGFTVTKGADHGIFVENSNDVTIENNTLTGNGTATIKGIQQDKPIELVGTAEGLVKDNTVTGNLADGGIGIADNGADNPGAYSSTATPPTGTPAVALDNTVEDNTIIGNAGGCDVVVASYNAGEGVIGNVVKDNTAEKSVAGVVIATDGLKTTATGNLVEGNTVSDNFISGIILHSNAPGDVLMDNTVTGNSLSGNGADGEVGDFATTAIVVAGAVNPTMNNTITNNIIKDEGLGIWLTGALGNHISGNTFDTTRDVAPNLEIVAPTTAKAGQPVSFTAAAATLPGALYQFWVHSATGWAMVQNYSSNATYMMKSSADGSYRVLAYALTPAQLKAGLWKDALTQETVLNVDSTLALSTMNSSTMSGMAGSPSMVTATASNLTHPVYQFWVESPKGTWRSSGAYSTDNTYNFLTASTVSPSVAGTYHVVAYAKDANAPENAAYEVVSQLATVNIAPTVDFALTPATQSIAADGSATLTLSQEYTTGALASEPNLDNLDSIFTITNASGQPASGFSIVGFGGTTEAMTNGTYTFSSTPTAVSGTVTITASASVPAGTYTVTASDPDHMDMTSTPVMITVQ